MIEFFYYALLALVFLMALLALFFAFVITGDYHRLRKAVRRWRK